MQTFSFSLYGCIGIGIHMGGRLKHNVEHEPMLCNSLQKKFPRKITNSTPIFTNVQKL